MIYPPLRSLAQKLIQLEFWLIGLIVVASLAWPVLLPLAVVLGVIFCFVRWIAFGYFIRRTPADWGVLLIIAMAVVSYSMSAIPEDTFIQVIRLLAGIALFYSIVDWGCLPSRVGGLVILLLLISMGLFVLGFFGVEWVAERTKFLPGEIFSVFKVWVSDPAHPNVLAGSLVLIAPLPFALILYNSGFPFNVKLRRWINFLYVICFISAASMIFLSQSRGAALALTLSFIVLIAMRWKWGWILGAALISIGALAAIVGGASLSALLLDNQTVGTLSTRVELWARGLSIVGNFPLTGIGMGLFGQVIGYWMPMITGGESEIVHAHNLFLQIAIDLGLPGLVGWISILLVSTAVAWKIYKAGSREQDRWVVGVGAGFLCMSVAMIAHGMVDAVVWGLRSAPLVWVIWGVTFAAGQLYLTGQK